MRSLVLLFAFFAVAFATDVERSFQIWRVENHKFYPSSSEYNKRFAIFSENLQRVEEFNKEEHSFTVGMNYFADLTNEEFVAIYTSPMAEADQWCKMTHVPSGNNPDSVDWRKQGIVNPVKNQGQCGSCYSFGAVAGMEGAIAQSKGSLLSLAEQQIVDCSGEFGNQGCNGGWHNAAMAYTVKYGLESESSYVYTAKKGTCTYDASKVIGHIQGCVAVGTNEKALEDAAAGHVVSIAIDASQWSFQMYKSGVYDEKKCSSTRLDHAVAIVGYGKEGSTPYWIVRNSWGSSWGLQGYIWMSKDKSNQCGVATKAYYAVA